MEINSSPIHVENLPDLKDPFLVAAFEGWNDGGQAASNTIRRLIKALNAEKFAWFDPEEFYVHTETRPEVRLVDGRFRKIEWQTNEFYHARIPDTGRDLVLFLGTEPQLKWKTFCRHFLTLARQVGVHHLVTLGGYLADTLYTLPIQINGFSNDEAFEQRYDLQRTNYEGPTGIVGVLSNLGQQEEFQVLSLWAAVPYYISIPNPKAVHALLSKLTEVYDFSIDLSSLEADANSFDNEINNIVAKDPNVAAYVRELKKRDFLN